MKKTIITAMVCCLFSAALVQANAETIENQRLVSKTIQKNVNVSTFCKAIMEGDYNTVKRLIELGENVNQKSLGLTPAIFAARYNKAEILKLLIDNGADLEIKSDKGYSVKKYAELSNAHDALSVIEAAMGS